MFFRQLALLVCHTKNRRPAFFERSKLALSDDPRRSRSKVLHNSGRVDGEQHQIVKIAEIIAAVVHCIVDVQDAEATVRIDDRGDHGGADLW